MINIIYYIILALITFIWGYVFYKKDYHPQPLKMIIWSFVMGIFAMIPVFGYKYVYQKLIPGIAEYEIFRPILDSPLLSGLAVFTFNAMVLAVVLFILSGAISSILNFFSHSVFINLKNAIKDEPFGFTLVSLFLGIAIFAQSFFKNSLGMAEIGSVLGSIIFLAVIEEFIKHLMVRITDDKKLKDIDDAITLSIIVGLAFAFVETIIYSISAGSVSLIFYRSMISLPIHLVASGILGYYYGLAHFARPIVSLEGKDGKIKWLPKLLTLKKSTLYHEEKIVEGIFFATLFHAAMNLFFEFDLGFLAVPFIVLGIVVIFRFYKTSRAEDRLIAVFQRKLNKRATA